MKTVVFETLWTHLADGWCISSRAYARAMALAGIDVRLKSWKLHEPLDDEVLAEIPEKMRTPVNKWDAHIFSCPFGGPEMMAKSQTFELFHQLNKPPRLFYTMFERTNVQPELVAELNRLEGVWVPCSINDQILREAGCKTSTWIPFPYFDDDPHLKLLPPRKEPKNFLWIGRWEPRKAPHNLIDAFTRAFKPGEARLTLKLGLSPWERSPYPDPEIPQGYSDDILIIRGKLSKQEMLALHADADIYVSASRGEGLDLPAYAAKLAGRRIVTTDSGGPRDFIDETDILVPACGKIPATEYEWLWGKGSTYNQYRLDNLAAAMRRARGSAVVPKKIDDKFRAENVAKRFASWLP